MSHQRQHRHQPGTSIQPRSRWQLAAKRAIDLAVGVPVIVLMSPLFALTALAIKLDSPGPVFYIDRRFGKHRRVFGCIKFRTMHHNSEQVLQAYLAANPDAAERWAQFRKLDDDPRITRVGRLLRKTTLDEFPQVLNILRGEMSILGPRPFMLREEDDIEPHLDEILSMPPGMAGMWIAHGRNNLTFEQRIQLELEYVHNWSLWLDAVLFWKSFWALVSRRGAA